MEILNHVIQNHRIGPSSYLAHCECNSLNRVAFMYPQTIVLAHVGGGGIETASIATCVVVTAATTTGTTAATTAMLLLPLLLPK